MNQKQAPQCAVSKTTYEGPLIDIIQISCEDVLTTSGNKDKNQGEWDSQGELKVRWASQN